MNVHGLTLRLFLPLLCLLGVGLLTGLLSWPLAVGLFVVILLIVGWLVLWVLRPLRRLQALLDETVLSDREADEGVIPGLDRRDEVGGLARGIQRLRNEQRASTRRRHLHDALTAFLPTGPLLQAGLDRWNKPTGGPTQPGLPVDDPLVGTVTRIQGSINQITLFTQDIYESFLDVRNQIQAIADQAQGANQSITTTADAVGVMDSRLAGVTVHLHEMEASMERVTQAVREMTASFDAIHRLTGRVSSESVDAGKLSQSAQQGIHQLTQSALAIGKVVEVIDSIAEQTNILALNAAIEAAGAGAFGAGFAVVANEVKELAQQTSRATQMIGDHIKEIQTMSEESLTVAQQVSSIMVRLASSNRDIAKLVTTQNAATQHILESMRGLSQNTSKILSYTNELSKSSQDVSAAAQASAVLTRGIVDSSQNAYAASEQVANQSDAIADLSKMAMVFVKKSREVVDALSQGRGGHPERVQQVVQWLAHFVAQGEMVRRLGHGLLSSSGGAGTGAEPFDLSRMYAAHVSFTEQLLHALDPTSGVTQAVLQVDVCPLTRLLEEGGRWVSARHKREYQAVLQLHETLHRVAGEWAVSVHQGSMADAQRAMAQFHGMQEALFSQLHGLHRTAATQAVLDDEE